MTLAGELQALSKREVRDRIAFVFETFLRVRSASKVLRALNREGLPLPSRDRFGDIAWRPPKVAAILAILKNPAYAGAYVYGRTAVDPCNWKHSLAVVAKLCFQRIQDNGGHQDVICIDTRLDGTTPRPQVAAIIPGFCFDRLGSSRGQKSRSPLR